MSVINLNVGGCKYTTTKSTLCINSKFFKELFETKVPVALDSKHRIFIDRNGERFGVILSMMRLEPMNLEEAEMDILIEEAKYYRCDGIVASLIKYNRETFLTRTTRVVVNKITYDVSGEIIKVDPNVILRFYNSYYYYGTYNGVLISELEDIIVINRDPKIFKKVINYMIYQCVDLRGTKLRMFMIDMEYYFKEYRELIEDVKKKVVLN